MKFASLIVFTALAQVSAGNAAAPMTPASVSSTNQLVILCDGGARATPTNAIWRRNVRAADSQLYLECELLTALFKRPSSTNTAKAVSPPAPQADESSSDTNRARIDSVIAETNVMIITPELQVMGDRAVYTASNDVLRVTGALVMVVDERGSTTCTNLVFDRANNVIDIEGWYSTQWSESTFSRTNAARRRPAVPPSSK